MPENDPLTITVPGSLAEAVRKRAEFQHLNLDDLGAALVSLGWAALEGMSPRQRLTALRYVRREAP